MGSTTLSGTPAFLGTSSVSYSAKDVRRFMTAAPIIYSAGGEGIVESGDFAVSQRAAGANQSVDVAAGEAYVKGDTSADEGSYYVRETATVNVTLTAADATNPRIDRVVLEIKNDSEDASGLNLARIRTIDGTPTVGATLTNLTGAAAVPNTCLLLANVLVSASDASIVTGDIQDRRFGVPIPGRELFGGYAVRTTSLAGAGTVATITVNGDGVNPVMFEGHAGVVYSSTAGGTATLQLMDGATELQLSASRSGVANEETNHGPAMRHAAFSGSKTVTFVLAGTATVNVGSSATRPAWLRATWGV